MHKELRASSLKGALAYSRIKTKSKTIAIDINVLLSNVMVVSLSQQVLT